MMAFFNSSLSLIIPLLLLLGLQLPSLAAIGVDTLISYNENAAAAGLGIVQLMRREKRGDHDMLDFTATFPPDYEIEDENNPATLKPGGAATPETTEHTYYNMTIHSQDAEMFDSVYVDIPNWISQSGAVGQTEHSHLEDAYRKAAGVQLKFEFPFYGHRLQNLTIATGGFLYVGDQTHSWLAATQYIAPLMANFDTMDVQNRSSIQYADDGKRMIVEWQQVTLRDNRPVGPFTFQVHLWRNGNITFVYKEVPIPVSNISDAHHPCKLGISDAYLFNHKVSTQSPSMPQSKRVIHEYHRITIPGDKIGPKTVVMLKALPTCLEANSCEDCIKLQMKPFKCGWCLPKEGGAKTEGGSTDSGSNKPFCSDQLGLHRRRQDWIEGNCQIQEPNQYCKAEEEPLTNGSSSSTVATADASTALPIAALVTKVGTTPVPGGGGAQKMEKPSVDKADESSQQEGSSGIAFITLFLLVGITASIWIGYAYFNPHTRSGQLLIKYRPSKWQIPSSHVRYSASVHM